MPSCLCIVIGGQHKKILLPQIGNCSPYEPMLHHHKIVSIKIRVICHKSTVILIELRWTFSMPENRLKSGISAVLAHKQTPLQSNSAAGFRFMLYMQIVAFCSAIIVKQPSYC